MVQGSIRAVLVDPSLFTGPYDAGLTQGLAAADVETIWAVRPVRRRQDADLPAEVCNPTFYRHVDDAAWIPARLRAVAKGLAHFVGLFRLARLAQRDRCDVIHMQWAVIPAVDALAIRLLRLRRPVVMTVHDTVPFNGSSIPWLQKAGFFWPARAATRVVVHTRRAAERLVAAGVAEGKISVVPHGPLPLPREGPARTRADVLPVPDGKQTFVLFGQIKLYKGLDVLVEAIALLDPATLARCRFVVAGAVMMDMVPIEDRIRALGLTRNIELRYGRLSDAQMMALFDETDVFLFPYRMIDASGVYYLVRQLGKWMIASRVGVFAEDFEEGEDGETIPAGDVQALARAIETATRIERPAPPAPRGASWREIGMATRGIYEAALQTTREASGV